MDPSHIQLEISLLWTWQSSHPRVLEEVVQTPAPPLPPSPSCHPPPGKTKGSKGIRCLFSLLRTSAGKRSGGWAWGRVMFQCGLRTLSPRAGIGEIGGIGCRDKGLLSPPSTGRRWLRSVCSLLGAVISCHQQTSWWKGQGETRQSPCFISLFCPWGQEPPKHPPFPHGDNG